MSKTALKLILWSILMLVAVAAGWGLLTAMARLIAYFQTGANPAAALNLVPNVPPDLNVRISWRPDPPDPGRPLDPLGRSEIESSYLRAWLQLNFSAVRNEPYGLQTYFSGGALEAVEQTFRQVRDSGWVVDQVDTAHELELRFYSADGAIVSFTDHGAWLSRIAHLQRDGTSLAIESVERYEVVMALEDGNWRIRHWVRATGGELGPLSPSRPAPGFVRREGRTLVTDSGPWRAAGVRYYPRDTPWDQFWPSYDGALTRRDFAIARRLGINTVRVGVPFEQFGGARPSAEMLGHLDDLLQAARLEQLKVIVSLFDGYSDIAPLRWPRADRHVEALVEEFAEESAILAWELKSDADALYLAHDRAIVDAWLRHIAHIARKRDRLHLIMIGWTNAGAAAALTDVTEIVSFRYREALEPLAASYDSLRHATEAPIFISDFGLSTANSLIFPGGHSEREQAEHHAAVLGFASASDAAGALGSALFDYSERARPPSGRFWEKGLLRAEGVIRRDGTPKLAARLFAGMKDGSAREAAASFDRVRRWMLFWGALTLLLVGVLALAFARRARSGQRPAAE